MWCPYWTQSLSLCGDLVGRHCFAYPTTPLPHPIPYWTMEQKLNDQSCTVLIEALQTHTCLDLVKQVMGGASPKHIILATVRIISLQVKSVELKTYKGEFLPICDDPLGNQWVRDVMVQLESIHDSIAHRLAKELD